MKFILFTAFWGAWTVALSGAAACGLNTLMYGSSTITLTHLGIGALVGAVGGPVVAFMGLMFIKWQEAWF